MNRPAALLVATAVFFVGVGPAMAQFYRWTDEEGHSHYSEGLDSIPERFRAAAQPLELRKQPDRPALSGNLPGRNETVVAFNPGRHIVVSVLINGATTARMILDTGAGRTLIHPRALVAAGVALGRGRSSVARGVVAGAKAEGEWVRVSSLEIGEARVGPMWVTAYDMGWGDEVGLLGQDFLGNFTVTIEPSRGIVRITPK